MAGVLVITGAAGGMGRATIKEFRARGFKIVGLDRVPDKESCDLYFEGEVTDESLWRIAQDAIERNFGQVDVLVNLAGRNYLANIDQSSLDEWRNMFEVNVIGMVASIKHMKGLLERASAPTIVNMSSISGYIGSVGYAAYCSTKGAIDSLTKSLALELAPKIRINAIAPGWIETPFTVEGLEKSPDPIKYRKDVEAMHALARVGQPEEIAKSIFWMSSSDSSFMTGSVVIVDGGYMIKN